MNVNIKLLKTFKPLFRKARFKICYGGRGRGASWNVSMFLILMSLQSKVRVLCCREVQNSIKESVHKLLSDTIERLGLDSYFSITDHAIRALNGSDFIFIGLQNSKNKITKVKSYEAVDYVYIEEGENISKSSLDVLIPTIRKTKEVKFKTQAGYDDFLTKNPEINYPEYIKEHELKVFLPAEIFVLFNPNFDDDEVYKRFVTNTPDSCILINSTYLDNSKAPATLVKEAEDCKKLDEDDYKHIYLGLPLGAGLKIYAKKFDTKVHMRKESKEDLLSYIAQNSVGNFVGIDPHSKYFPFAVWLAVVLNEHEEPEHIIYNEFPTYEYLGGFYADMRKKKLLELTLKQLAQLIYSYDGNEYGITVKNRFVDTRYSKGAGGENVMTNSIGLIETWKTDENGAMILNTPSEKMIDIQRANILTDLNYNRDLQLSPFNRPKLTVAPWCKNMKQMFMSHRETTDGVHEDEKFKDPSDALRILYAGIAGKTFKRAKKIKSIRNKQASWMGV